MGWRGQGATNSLYDTTHFCDIMSTLGSLSPVCVLMSAEGVYYRGTGYFRSAPSRRSILAGTLPSCNYKYTHILVLISPSPQILTNEAVSVYFWSVFSRWYRIINKTQIEWAPECAHDNIAQIVVKACSYIAQYPVLRPIQSALHFTSLTDLFTQTPSRLL